MLVEAGCFGRTLPTEYGGQGGDMRAFAIQQEMLATVWPSAAVAATWTNLGGKLINKFGSSDQRRELLPALADGTRIGAVAWTEPSGGSDAAGIKTTAVRDGDAWKLTGSKCFIDNARDAEFFIVGCRLADETSRHPFAMFIVRREDAGFRFEGTHDTLGLRPAGVGRFRLDGCRVGDDRLLGAPGRGLHQMMSMVEFGRTGVAALCLGISEAALSEAVQFLRTRRSFGHRLAENDAILARVADLRVRIDAARLLTERAVALIDGGVACAREAAMAKLFSSEVAVEVTSAALHLLGGRGYTAESPIEMLHRDSHAFTIGEGTSEIMRKIIGRDEFLDA
jgi:alkylation response protein AidB-like acyl-CoA dehydrogenase